MSILPPVTPSGPFLYGTRKLMRVILQRGGDVEARAAGTEREVRRAVHIFERQSANESVLRVAELMHRRVDRAMAEQDLRQPDTVSKVPCSRGCSACCFQLVTVCEPEAQLAMDEAARVGHPVDLERARKQAAEPDDYNGLPHADRRCVMLRDDGDCAIYEHRPTACRSYRVLTPPEQCDLELHPDASTLVLVDTTAEIHASAAMRAFRYGSLASFITEANDHP